MSFFKTIKQCRSCGSDKLHVFLDLGTTPLADRLVKEGDLDKEDLEAPLTVAFCEDCTLVQILETVDPEVLFQQDYPYYSSVSPFLMRHFQDSALALIEERGLSTTSLVIEAASNDGYMLRNFADNNIPVLGIDPAPLAAGEANNAGIETICDFFGLELAKRLRDKGHAADLLIAIADNDALSQRSPHRMFRFFHKAIVVGKVQHACQIGFGELHGSFHLKWICHG